jgi:hypothetical protein
MTVMVGLLSGIKTKSNRTACDECLCAFVRVTIILIILIVVVVVTIIATAFVIMITIIMITIIMIIIIVIATKLSSSFTVDDPLATGMTMVMAMADAALIANLIVAIISIEVQHTVAHTVAVPIHVVIGDKRHGGLSHVRVGIMRNAIPCITVRRRRRENNSGGGRIGADNVVAADAIVMTTFVMVILIAAVIRFFVDAVDIFLVVRAANFIERELDLAQNETAADAERGFRRRCFEATRLFLVHITTNIIKRRSTIVLFVNAAEINTIIMITAMTTIVISEISTSESSSIVLTTCIAAPRKVPIEIALKGHTDCVTIAARILIVGIFAVTQHIVVGVVHTAVVIVVVDAVQMIHFIAIIDIIIVATIPNIDGTVTPLLLLLRLGLMQMLKLRLMLLMKLMFMQMTRSRLRLGLMRLTTIQMTNAFCLAMVRRPQVASAFQCLCVFVALPPPPQTPMPQNRAAETNGGRPGLTIEKWTMTAKIRRNKNTNKI